MVVNVKDKVSFNPESLLIIVQKLAFAIEWLIPTYKIDIFKTDFKRSFLKSLKIEELSFRNLS